MLFGTKKINFPLSKSEIELCLLRGLIKRNRLVKVMDCFSLLGHEWSLYKVYNFFSIVPQESRMTIAKTQVHFRL